MIDKPSVLILDDEIEVGEILAVLLEDSFTCSVFHHANTALTALEQSAYDYIISDIEMPDINGIRFIEEARRKNPTSTVIISTGHDVNHPRVREAMTAGAHGILTKPFLDPDALVKTLIAYSSHAPSRL